MNTTYYFVSYVIQDQENPKRAEFKNAVCSSHPFEWITFINNGMSKFPGIAMPKAILLSWRNISEEEYKMFQN
jgi:hypothetical protein